MVTVLFGTLGLVLTWLVFARFGIQRPTRRLDFDEADPGKIRFPKPMAFGAASAAYQIEGGITGNNWARWELETRKDGKPAIQNGDRCGSSADHWNRFDNDVRFMKELGLTAYRFSIEWSRIEPKEGLFDPEPLDRYRSWCITLREAGITPVVTLHHFSEPAWVTADGGFENVQTVDRYARFVRYVVPVLADVVDDWVTINEPVVWATLGWMLGEFPPGVEDPQRALNVLENLMRAHAAAYGILHELDRSDADGDGQYCRVGLAKNIITMEAARWWHPGDQIVTRMLHTVYNKAVIESLVSGRLVITLPGSAKIDVMIPGLKDSFDYIGLNHYTRNRVVFDPRSPGYYRFQPGTDVEQNDMGWDLYPQSFYDALLLVGEYGKPVWVTENGICDSETPDRRRVRFLTDCLYALSQAVRDGVNVPVYLHWAIMDNFEWSFGFTPRFGLYRVDYSTQERTLTEGGKRYQEIIRDSAD